MAQPVAFFFLQGGNLSSGEMDTGSLHCLVSAAVLFFLFSTPPTPTPLNSRDNPAQHCEGLCRELSECKVQGKLWEGQVRTEKGDRKRSVTQAQSDGSQLSCSALCPSTVHYFYSATIHTSGDHNSFHHPRSSSPLTGSEAGEGGRRDRYCTRLPAPFPRLKGKRKKNQNQNQISGDFQRPASLWALSISDEGTC